MLIVRQIILFMCFAIWTSCSTNKSADQGGGGNGTGNSNSGQGEGSSQTNPNQTGPNQPFNQNRSGQCQENAKLTLTGSSEFGLVARRPRPLPVVKIEIVRERPDPKDNSKVIESKSSCHGVLGSVTYPARVGGTGPAGMKRDNQVELVFPRIMTAGHCLREEFQEGQKEPGVIKYIKFSHRSSTGEIKTTSYSLVTNSSDPKVPNGILRGDVSEENYWFLPKSIGSKPEESACTTDVNQKIKSQSGVDKDFMSKVACISVNRDRIDFTSIHEWRYHAEFALHPGIVSPELYSAVGESLAQSLPTSSMMAPDRTKSINWKEAFLESFVRGSGAASLDDTFVELARAQSKEQFYEFLDRKLKALEISVIVKDKNHSGRVGFDKKPEDGIDPYTGAPCKGWRCKIEVFGSSVGDAGAQVFRPDSYAIKEPSFGLGKGQSGAILKFSFVDVKSPLMNIVKTDEVGGVLSTVGGDPVCSGDDLLCCERSE